MKIVYRAANIIEAHIVCGMLQANGIEAHVGGYYLQGGIGDLAPLDIAHVSVPDEDEPAALSIVRAYESGAYEGDASEP
jgi:hypothetical protein